MAEAEIKIYVFLLCTFLLVQCAQSLKCYKCEIVYNNGNDMSDKCTKGDKTLPQDEEFPTKDSTPLCYTYKAVLDVGAGKKIDFLRRDVRKTGNVKYTGKCVLTKDMDPKEIPVGTSGEFCFCDKDLCNSGPFKAGVARQSVLSMTSLVGSVVLTSTTFIRHYRELVMY